MTTAVIGPGNIGSAVVRNLVWGGEPVVLAARTADSADGSSTRSSLVLRSRTPLEQIKP